MKKPLLAPLPIVEELLPEPEVVRCNRMEKTRQRTLKEAADAAAKLSQK
jgi:hypothetical protein